MLQKTSVPLRWGVTHVIPEDMKFGILVMEGTDKLHHLVNDAPIQGALHGSPSKDMVWKQFQMTPLDGQEEGWPTLGDERVKLRSVEGVGREPG